MFCPNCGTKNDDTATPCTKCGLKLSGASAPKFRGTMMLNSDQSMQDMVEEHRRKLAEAGATQKPASEPEAGTPAPATATPPAGAPGAPKSGLQPPRAGLPKRRMGTMLGVAPQIGGILPPQDVSGSTPTPLPASTGSEPRTGDSPPDPLGGTVAFAAVPPAAPQPATRTPGEGPAEATPPAASLPAFHPLASGRTEAFAAAGPDVAPAPAISPLTAGRTEAFQAVPAAIPSPLTAGRTEAFAAVPAATPAAPATPARGRTEGFEATPAGLETAAAPATQPQTPSRARDSYHPAGVPRLRLRPLDVFLVVITCGLYALVLWARQQRKPS